MADDEDASAAIIPAPNGAGPPPILLVDHTIATVEPEPGEGSDSPRAPSSLSKNFGQGSLRKTIARRKYQRSKWQQGEGARGSGLEGRESSGNSIEEGSGNPNQEDGSSKSNREDGSPDSKDAAEARRKEEDEEPSLPGQTPSQLRQGQGQDQGQGQGEGQGLDGGAHDAGWGESSIRRRGRQVKGLIRSKANGTKLRSADPDSHIDILYENQRGFFLFGIPRFSSKSLLNFDPSAWLDSRFHPSAVNITNAQVPDPSWEWSWRTWYVDMSGDVDEEGWEYSFWFGNRMAWHGTHPWFHSFVRRRRWLRKRTKSSHVRARNEAHALTADYFTIHSRGRRRGMDEAGTTGTADRSANAKYATATSTAWGAKTWEQQSQQVEIANIADLLRCLRKAAIDREKLVLLRRFLEDSGDELHYLPLHMEQIMRLLVFQNSRRQLLAMLMHELEAAEGHREEHLRRGLPEDPDEKRQIDDLIRAAEEADELCKQLEYWSDVKDVVREGEVLKAVEHSHGWAHDWRGADGPYEAAVEDDAMPDQTDGTTTEKGKQRGGEDTPNSAATTPTPSSYSHDRVPARPPPTLTAASEDSIDSFDTAASRQESIGTDDADDDRTERAPSDDERE